MTLYEQEITKYLRKFIGKVFRQDFDKVQHKNIMEISKKSNLSPTSITFLYNIYNEICVGYETIQTNLRQNIQINKMNSKETNEILSLNKCKNLYQNTPTVTHLFEKPATEVIAYKCIFRIPIPASTEGANICVYFLLPLEKEDIFLIHSKKIDKYIQECIGRIYI